jgi:hypothetical protein
MLALNFKNTFQQFSKTRKTHHGNGQIVVCQCRIQIFYFAVVLKGKFDI